MSEPAWVPLGPAAVLDVGPEVAYQEFTANVSVPATTEAGATPIVTAPAFTADGSSQYLVEFFAMEATPPGTSGQSIALGLFMDGVAQGLIAVIAGNSANPLGVPVRVARKVTPAAGAHVFAVRAWVSTSTGNVLAGPGGASQNVPGFIRVTKVPSAAPGAPAGVVPPVAVVTALPASPVDGQEIVLVDSLTAPTYSWRLRYLAAKAANRWLFIGGAPAYSEQTAADAVTSTAYVALANAGPSITVPVAGDYLVAIGFSESAGGQDVQAFMSYDVGATAAVDADCVRSGPHTGGGAGQQGGVVRERRKSLAAGTALVSKYKGATAASITLRERWMRVEPVALGG